MTLFFLRKEVPFYCYKIKILFFTYLFETFEKKITMKKASDYVSDYQRKSACKNDICIALLRLPK